MFGRFAWRHASWHCLMCTFALPWCFVWSFHPPPCLAHTGSRTLNKQYCLCRTDGPSSKSGVCQKWSGQTYIHTNVEAGEHSGFHFLDFVSIFLGSSIVGINCAVGYKEILFIVACNGSEWVREEGKCDRLMASSVLEAFARVLVVLVV